MWLLMWFDLGYVGLNYLWCVLFVYSGYCWRVSCGLARMMIVYWFWIGCG